MVLPAAFDMVDLLRCARASLLILVPVPEPVTCPFPLNLNLVTESGVLPFVPVFHVLFISLRCKETIIIRTRLQTRYQHFLPLS
jgi:hypothetical protein